MAPGPGFPGTPFPFNPPCAPILPALLLVIDVPPRLIPPFPPTLRPPTEPPGSEGGGGGEDRGGGEENSGYNDIDFTRHVSYVVIESECIQRYLHLHT